MDTIETEDDKRRRLEIEKLQFQVNKLKDEAAKKQKTPNWIFAYLQPLIPTIFTICSLIITSILLYNSHLFATNNTLLLAEKENLSAQKENLIRDIKDFGQTKDSLNSVVARLNGTILRQHADSLRLERDNKIYKGNLEKSLNSLKPKDKQILELTIERDRQTEKVSNYYGIISNFSTTWKNFQKYMEEGRPYTELRGELSIGVNDIFNAAKYNKP